MEIFIGESLTSKKLMDLSSKTQRLSTSEGSKRKLEELSPNTKKYDSNHNQNQKESFEDKKAKRLKMIEEIQNIKSNHSSEASDSNKNPHLGTYNKQQDDDKIEGSLSNLKDREVRVVTCQACSSTLLTQSDFCKLKKHEIRRHMVLQRFFKCKSCSKRMDTLDKVYPVEPCTQCGSEKYEQCTMKDDAER